MSTSRDVDQHFAVFQNLVAQADNYLKSGNYSASAIYAQMAAAYAIHHHSGLYASYQLERILNVIGRTIASKTYFEERNVRHIDHKRHVLHVLTEAIGVGGHTRMVWRWIQQDPESRHSVVLTRQHVKIPHALIDAAKASGGRSYRLNDNSGNVLAWSQELRRIAASADVVVLHIFAYDVIPLIAFADKRSMPPILLLNIGDHKFWLGVSISDLVVEMRRSGTELTQTRRGVDKTRYGFLPIVLPPITRKVSISDAKAQIGLSQDTILLLSIARHSKYGPYHGYGSKFNDLVLPDSILPVLEQHPNSALIVIGPEFSERWEQASRTVQGRISALGRREDTAIYYQAADIYLDSFPFASITSCLEAGSYGLPLVTCYPYTDVSAVLGADTPALENTILRVRDKSEFVSVVTHLVEDPEYRTCIGKDTQENIISVHTGDNWNRYLHDLYLQAASISPNTTIDNVEDQKMITELDILSSEIDVIKEGEHMIYQDHMRLLPFDLRVNLWLQLLKENHAFKPSLLLSEWMAVKLKSARSSILKKSV